MKQVICRAAAIAAALLVSTSVFAGAVTTRPVTEFELIAAGLGPVDIITPTNAATGEDRHLQSLAVSVRDEQGNALAGVTCTLANDQGPWSLLAGETVTIRRSSSELRITCVKDDQVIASTVVPSAQTRVALVTGLGIGTSSVVRRPRARRRRRRRWYRSAHTDVCADTTIRRAATRVRPTAGCCRRDTGLVR